MADRPPGVCATGRIDADGRGHQITVGSAKDITVLGESARRIFAPHAYRPNCDPGLVLPKLVRERKPAYTRRAMREKVQGTVWMEAVVEPDGKVGDAWIIKFLHKDLDQQAVFAAREWQFEPATLNGQPVAAIITIEMTFTLKK